MKIRQSLAASLAAMAISVAAAGCDSAPPGIHTIHTDSAGIPVATAIEPLWGPDDGWTVEPEPLLEIGTVTGATEYLFTDVVAAVRLSNGDIVVAERGASELRSYDAAGNFRWRAGRDGEGPGEFRSLDFVGATVGDSLVTYDGRLLRAQLFDPQGRLARTYRVAISEGEASGRGVLADKAVGVVDGRLVVRFIEYGERIPIGVVRWPPEQVAALDLADGAVRSLIELPGREAYVEAREEGRYSHGTYVFANGPEYGAAAGRLAVIDTEAWSVRLISPHDGTITAVLAGAEPPPFEILAPDGTWLGSVSLPPGLHRAFIQYQAPYMEIGDDYVLGVWTDELDVQYVRMYRINR